MAAYGREIDDTNRWLEIMHFIGNSMAVTINVVTLN